MAPPVEQFSFKLEASPTELTWARSFDNYLPSSERLAEIREDSASNEQTFQNSEKRSADPSTQSEPLGKNRARVCDLNLDWTIDFDAKVIYGAADLMCAPTGPVGEPLQVVLDTNGLKIKRIFLFRPDPEKGVFWFEECPFTLEEAHPTFGSRLIVKPAPILDSMNPFVIRVEYETAPGPACSALHWLSGEQTTSGKYPFLFSQCQAIHARSLFPIQDTCECKVTYQANVRYPAALTTLMSAVRDREPKVCMHPPGELGPLPDGLGTDWAFTHFKQTVPVPSYLIAIACGEVEARVLSPRVSIWAEPGVVEKAAWEFAETEKILETATEICGEYRFGCAGEAGEKGKYLLCMPVDLLVLPPSFPYGGMENPCLTFLTPTLLAGDRSQVAVVAHEIAHSWSGNLVTNHTWEHFFMNEGLTVFVETRIVEKVWGHEQATLRAAHGWHSLCEACQRFGPGHEFTKLCPNMGGVDPDDSFSVVPYEKGCALFRFVEDCVGGPEKFEPFIKAYFNNFARKTVTAQQFRAFLESYFSDSASASDALQKIDWDAWLTRPDLPPRQASSRPCSSGRGGEKGGCLARGCQERRGGRGLA